MTTPNSIRVADLLKLLHNHHQRHEADGTDPLNVAKSSIAIVTSMKNGSGGRLAMGSVVVLDPTMTTDNTFTTSTVLYDTDVCGVLLQDTPIGGFGLVAIGGKVDRVRVAAGVTKYQYLSQSSTAGVAVGSDTPAPGCFAITLADRDAAGFCPVLLERFRTQVGEWIPASACNSNGVATVLGGYDVWELIDGAQRYVRTVVRISEAAPEIVNVSAICVAAASGNLATFSSGNYAAIGEDYNLGNFAAGTDVSPHTHPMTINDITAIALLDGGGIEQANFLGFSMTRDGSDAADTIGASVYFLGFLLTYRQTG